MNKCDICGAVALCKNNVHPSYRVDGVHTTCVECSSQLMDIRDQVIEQQRNALDAIMRESISSFKKRHINETENA